jgi:hypothetical protein
LWHGTPPQRYFPPAAFCGLMIPKLWKMVPVSTPLDGGIPQYFRKSMVTGFVYEKNLLVMSTICPAFIWLKFY